MASRIKQFLIIIFTIFISTQALIDDIDITVAVVEYQPDFNISTPAEERLNKTAKDFIEILQGLNTTILDLIVYPEAAFDAGHLDSDNILLYSTVAQIDDTPCQDTTSLYPDFIKDISCAAKNTATYIVINVVEKENCTTGNNDGANCQNYGVHLYNTNMIFDESGKIVQRYRKFNLFGEYALDKPAVAEHAIFTIKEQKFGTVTCFDILFREPTEELVIYQANRLVFPSMWFGELPFLTALQAQQMWAQAHNSILYAAGANNPALGSGGSGIYDGAEGPKILDIIAAGGSKAYVYTPRDPLVTPLVSPNLSTEDDDLLAKDLDSFHLKTDDLTEYSSTLLPLTNNTVVTTELCHNNSATGDSLCCFFTTQVTVDGAVPTETYYRYHLVAYTGVRSFTGVYNGGIDVCALLACLNDTLASCGQRFEDYSTIAWPLTFHHLEIKTNFTLPYNRTQYPNSLKTSLRPLPASETEWNLWRNGTMLDKNYFVERTWRITKEQDRLLTFAIYGRNFELDSPPSGSKDGGANSWTLNYFLYFTVFIVTYLTIFTSYWNGRERRRT